MPAPLSCTSCGNLLAARSATGMCPACAPLDPTQSHHPSDPNGAPPAVLPRNDTPNAAADRTPPQRGPDPYAPTEPDGALTTSAPAAPAERPWPHAPAGYMFVNKIGRGGMGDVYLAHEALSNQFVALKFLRDPGDPQLLERFQLEFRALRALNHPNAVRVLGHDFQRADPYFVLELMEGGSLAERIDLKRKLGEPFAPAEAVGLIRKVAGAVAALHTCRGHRLANNGGILHRDIKPANVLLTADGEPKLADFGLAKFLDASTVHTHGSGLVGTLRYMPPEQINGKNGELGFPADVYGLGATLYHLLTGRAPFVEEEFGELLVAVLTAAPEDPRALRGELTRGLSAVVMKCLEKDPRDRYPTVAAFLDALDRWADREQAPPVPFRQRARKWVKRNSRAVAVCALLVAAGTAGAVGAARPQPRPGPASAEADHDSPKRLKSVRTEFERTGAVALVPERGPPNWYDWPVGPSRLGQSPLNDGACFFQAVGGLSMLELFRPTTDRYQFTAQVQTVGAELDGQQIAPPEVGVFLGHTLYPRAAGPPARGLLLFSFFDHDREKAAGREPQQQPLRFGWRCMIGEAGKVASPHQTPFRVGTFTANDRFPTPWWTVTIDVSPELLVARWARAGGAEVELVRVTRAERLKAFVTYRIQAETVAKRAAGLFDHGPLPEDWNPTGGLGVWCNRARVAVKNVSVSVPKQ